MKDFKPGDTFRAKVPFSRPKSIKVHIDHVLQSIYEEDKLIIYRVYGKHKQYWHEIMCYDYQMELYIDAL